MIHVGLQTVRLRQLYSQCDLTVVVVITSIVCLYMPAQLALKSGELLHKFSRRLLADAVDTIF